MWRTAAARVDGFMGGPASSWTRWAAKVPHRFKTSSSSMSVARSRSRSSLRTGTVESTPFRVKPNMSVPMWQPSAKYMKYKPVRWLSNHLFAIATYQLTLEVGFTVIFGSLLYAEKITAQSVCDTLEAWHYPFVNWIDVEGGVYREPVRVGPFTLNAQKMTALHTGHNIASGILPLQLLLLVTTFVPVQHAYRLLRRAAPATASASHPAGGIGAANAAAADAASTASLTSVATGARRASYARATNGTRASPPLSH
ncbi:hypothetical protein, conserved [Leishmania tarentolae]|uniref:Uncharacterized protein n=1 Tax=Leishmania tarentolae TaxID=5689 RepID=A0A640KGP1_LEITA|nr:hypothetical protein, conserved [Leishmania tarentolae]